MKKPSSLSKPSQPAEATPALPSADAAGAAGRIARELSLLSRSQDQVEQRLAVGVQAVKAAEAMVSESINDLDALRAEQEELRQQMRQEVVQSLRSYDQWVGRVERDVTEVVHLLDERLACLENRWEQMQGHLQAMVHRAEALLEQSVVLLQRGPARSEAVEPAKVQMVRPTPRPAPAPLATEAAMAAKHVELVKAAEAVKPVEAVVADRPIESPADRVFSRILQQLGKPVVSSPPKAEDQKQQTPEADAA